MPKIFIGNLFVESCPTYEAELRGMFEQFGEVTECSILTGKNYGFVHMSNEDEAKIAIAGLNGQDFHGSQINVELSPNQGSRGGGRGAGRGDRGSRGGRGRGGGFERGRGRGRGKDRYDPYSRRDSYYSREDRYADPYEDPYADAYPPPRRLPPRDPYDDPYYRDPYTRDPYARDPYARDPYARDPYARDPYGRPPPDYYARLRDSDPYYERSSARESDLVSYPPPRGATNGYGKDSYRVGEK